MPCSLVDNHRRFAATHCLCRPKKVTMSEPPVEVTKQLRCVSGSNCFASLLRQLPLWRNRRPEYGGMSPAVRFNRNVMLPAVHCTGDWQLKLRVPQILQDDSNLASRNILIFCCSHAFNRTQIFFSHIHDNTVYLTTYNNGCYITFTHINNYFMA
jgi:hypothetical protein